MWMMTGCRSGRCGEPNINNRVIHDYSIKAANIQPAVVLTPKLSATSNITQNSALPFNHHHYQVIPVTPSEQGRSGGDYFYNDQQPAAAAAVAPPRSSRWNPTPEQLLALEELYRRGIKTPTAQKIRQVTALLQHFGKIEGKNVFYWFQNHRARERKKRRRELMSSMSQSHSKEPQQQSWTNNLISSIQNKESAGGLKNLSLEGEQQNKWTLSNCTILSDQESSSVLQERMGLVESNSSKQPVDQSYSAAPTSQPPCANPSVTLIDTKPLDYHHYYDYDYDYGMVLTAPHICKGEENRETRTLELFPLERDSLKGVTDSTLPQSKKNTTADFVADQYFQFL